MKIKSVYVLTIIAALFAANSFGGTNNVIEIGTDSGVAGATVDIPLTWTQGASDTADGLQFDVVYDNANLSFVSCTLNPPYDAYDLANCGPFGDDVRIGLIDDFVSPGSIPSGVLGTVTFMIDGGATAGNYPLTFGPLVDVGNSSDGVDLFPGNVEVVDIPVPNYNSTPPAGSTIDFGFPTEGSGDVQMMLNIENNGTPGGGTMDVACSITNNPGGVYSLVSPMDGMFTLDIGENADLTIACNTDVAGDYTGGALSCDHDAPNAPDPATYTLDCLVTGDPVYASTPYAPGDPIPLGAVPQGSTPPVDGILINNDGGEVGSILAGDCSLVNNDTPIELVGGPTVPYSVMMGAGPAGMNVTCDTSGLQGVYNDTLSCTENDPVFGGPATYPVSCEILPPLPAEYASSPYAAGNPGALIDLNEGNPPPPVGGTAPTTVLTIMNAAPAGNDYLDLLGCTYSGDAEITAAPPNVTDDLDPGQSVNVTFTCSTAGEGIFTGTYTCPFDDNPSNIPPPAGPEGGGGVTSPATYPVECEVRDQFSDVVETPPSGTPQTAELMPGEGVTFDFNFEEIVGEGDDGSLTTCSLTTGTDFSITTSTVYPQVIPSGGPPVLVQVEFTDPGMGDTFNDTLNCSFTDNPDGGEPENNDVSWPLEVTVVGRNATFRVTKDFDDDNPAGVEVSMVCNTGLPLQQSGVIHDPDAADLGPGDFTFVDFVIVDFEPGAMDCDIAEVVPAGYTESYFADVGDNGVAGSIFADDDGCHYEGVESADFICEITNELQSVPVTVFKEWIDEHPEYQLPTFAEITLWCNEPIFFLVAEAEQGAGSAEGANGLYTATTYIQPGSPGNFSVYPHWDGSTFCFVTETPEAGVIQDLSDCENIPLAPGQGGECTVVNTRLFAGIPTLSQYGLILLALLMLGVGLVGFRRYT